jgi:hypothetical protein
MAAIEQINTISLPLPRDPLPDAYPAIIKCVKATLAGGSDASTDFTGVVATSDGNACTADLFNIPYGAIIHDVGWRVAVAFNANVDLSIGDSDDADGYAQVAHVDATNADGGVIWTLQSVLRTAQYNDSDAQIADTDVVGAYFVELPMMAWNSSTALADLPLVVTQATANASTGVLEVYVWYSDPWPQLATS